MDHRLIRVLVLLMLPGLALAASPPQKYFGLLGVFVDPDSQRFTNEEGFGFDFLLGREIEPWLYVEFRGNAEIHETGANRGSDNYRGAGGIDLQYLLGRRGAFSAFALAGGGFAFNDVAGNRNDDGTVYGNVGIGLLSRAMTNADVRIRIEGRARYEDFGPGMTDYRVGFGLEFPIDPVEVVVREVAGTAPAAAPAPPPSPGSYPARPVDQDQDGVLDYFDRCPGTEAGILVDATGCKAPFIGDDFSLQGVEFDTASTDLTPAAQRVLDTVAEALRNRPTKSVTIAGHTDSQGGNDYNLVLSLGRAQSVKRYLTQRGIAASRLKAAGFGESRPLDTNDTVVGRARNRRVEFRVDERFDDPK